MNGGGNWEAMVFSNMDKLQRGTLPQGTLGMSIRQMCKMEMDLIKVGLVGSMITI